MTRAKDILLMTAAVPDPYKLTYIGESVLKANVMNARDLVCMVLPFMHFSDVAIVEKSELALSREQAQCKVLESLDSGFEVDIEKLPLPKEELAQRLLYDYSPSPQSLKKRKYSVSGLAELAREKAQGSEAKAAKASVQTPVYSGGPRRLPLFAGGSVKLDAAAKGNAYHKVMEQLPFTAEGKSIEEIKAFIEGLRQRRLLSEQEAAAVEPERIAAFFASDIGKRAVAAKELHKEASFLLKTELDGAEAVVQGTIDCYFREGQGYVLVDYKSNYINPDRIEEERERLKEHYAPQLRLYREALEKITGSPVSEAVLYLFGMNDAIKL